MFSTHLLNQVIREMQYVHAITDIAHVYHTIDHHEDRNGQKYETRTSLSVFLSLVVSIGNSENHETS